MPDVPHLLTLEIHVLQHLHFLYHVSSDRYQPVSLGLWGHSKLTYPLVPYVCST